MEGREIKNLSVHFDAHVGAAVEVPIESSHCQIFLRRSRGQNAINEMHAARAVAIQCIEVNGRFFQFDPGSGDQAAQNAR